MKVGATNTVPNHLSITDTKSRLKYCLILPILGPQRWCSVRSRSKRDDRASAGWHADCQGKDGWGEAEAGGSPAEKTQWEKEGKDRRDGEALVFIILMPMIYVFFTLFWSWISVKFYGRGWERQILKKVIWFQSKRHQSEIGELEKKHKSMKTQGLGKFTIIL